MIGITEIKEMTEGLLFLVSKQLSKYKIIFGIY